MLVGSGVVTTAVLSTTSGASNFRSGRSPAQVASGAAGLKQKFPSLELLSVTSMKSDKLEPREENEKGRTNVKKGLPPTVANVMAPSAPKFATSVSVRFGENGIFAPGKPSLSFISTPAGVVVLRLVPVGRGSVIARDSVPAGSAPCIWYENPTWQVPVVTCVFASEQNINESIVTPSLIVVLVLNTPEASLPYEERPRVGTELADEVNATAKIAAKAKIRLSFFMRPPSPKDRTTPRNHSHVGFQLGTKCAQKQIS